jgi:hypothetical protein
VEAFELFVNKAGFPPGKSPKRRPRWKKRGDFEEAPRLAGMIVTGNRLARQWYHR